MTPDEYAKLQTVGRSLHEALIKLTRLALKTDAVTGAHLVEIAKALTPASNWIMEATVKGVTEPEKVRTELCWANGCTKPTASSGVWCKEHEGVAFSVADAKAAQHTVTTATDSGGVVLSMNAPLRRAPWDGDPTGLCEKCGARPAKSWWMGDASFSDVNHGAPVYAWCEVCMIDAQLEHCRTQAARIPELEAERTKLLTEG